MRKAPAHKLRGSPASKEAERQHRVHLRRKAAGTCVCCGKFPAVPERTQCAACLARLSRRAKERTAERKSLGLCVQCGRPSAKGIIHCRVCRPLSKRFLARRLAAKRRRRDAEKRKSRTRALIREHLHLFTSRQREVMILRAGLNGREARTGREIADMLGVSRQAVSIVERAAWRRIKRR
jgi:sigma-70-like protein